MTAITQMLTWLVSENLDAPTFSDPEKLVIFSIVAGISLVAWVFISRNHRKRAAQRHGRYVRDQGLHDRFRII